MAPNRFIRALGLAALTAISGRSSAAVVDSLPSRAAIAPLASAAASVAALGMTPLGGGFLGPSFSPSLTLTAPALSPSLAGVPSAAAPRPAAAPAAAAAPDLLRALSSRADAPAMAPAGSVGSPADPGIPLASSGEGVDALQARSASRFDGSALRAGLPAVPDSGPADDAPLPVARRLAWRGIGLPSSALRPYEPVSDLIGKALDQAHSTIRIAMYELDHQILFDALKRAKARGVKIEIVLDRSHVYTSGKDHLGKPRKPKQMVVDLIQEGFDVLTLKGRGSGIQHNKFTLIDGELLQTGSYNYTDQSESDHFENAVFSEDAARIAAYNRYFDYMRGLAEPVDMDRLDEILKRTEVAAEEAPEAFDLLAPGALDIVLPPPPADSESPIRFNGQSFPREMFSPGGGADQALLRAVEAAKTSIEIAMFSFFSKPLAEALLKAKDRGVKVRVVLDQGQSALSKFDEWFAWHGFEVKVLAGPDAHGDHFFQKMHNKLGLFDGMLLETGSYNYSANAENNNFENANFFDDPLELARYAEYFARLFARGRAPRPPKKEPSWADSEPSV
jgi:phosphatidylserine/phosphatidylglycerophosphate/cardiolipin synthase-like enzyme